MSDCSTTGKFTFEQLDALTAAIAQGVKSVKYSDKEVTYPDLDSMMKLREQMRQELCPDNTEFAAGIPGRRRRVAVFHSGHYPVNEW